MKIREKNNPEIELTLTADEFATLKKCLDYCWHRLTQHHKSFAQKDKVEVLRDEISIFIDENE